MRYELHNLDGRGPRRTQVYDMPPATDDHDPYWSAVTDVPCPAPRCAGTVRWAEAGYVPGYRVCDRCHRHYLASGSTNAPALLRVGSRRYRIGWQVRG
jgi:hypothetical protein